MTLLVGSLFSGIGGFDLGLERAGMRVAWQCEADDFCRRVLARHWPDVPCYPDVRELRHPEPVDVLCGGFPCQDISLAGKGIGIEGARSGLWGEYARLVGELRPRYVIVENVAALLSRGLGRVLGDLAALGYDAEWDCIPASAVGAPHRRDRLWIVAYPDRRGGPKGPESARSGSKVADAHEVGRQRAGTRCEYAGRSESTHGRPQGVADPDSESPIGSPIAWSERDPWAVEPDVGRMAHGVPGRMDRIGALGNALVPQIAEWLGRQIIEWEREQVTELVA